MEEFATQVAWPRVQLPSQGGGEASVTQKPQPQPKATPETPPQASPVTTPVWEVSDEEGGAADTDYPVDSLPLGILLVCVDAKSTSKCTGSSSKIIKTV